MCPKSSGGFIPVVGPTNHAQGLGFQCFNGEALPAFPCGWLCWLLWLRAYPCRLPQGCACWCRILQGSACWCRLLLGQQRLSLLLVLLSQYCRCLGFAGALDAFYDIIGGTLSHMQGEHAFNMHRRWHTCLGIFGWMVVKELNSFSAHTGLRSPSTQGLSWWETPCSQNLWEPIHPAHDIV